MADKNWGMLAQFDNPARLLEAAQGVNDAGYKKFETYSPFPVHGMDDAMSLPGSKVPWITLAGGITGFTTGVLLQYLSGTVGYAMVIGGKPLFAWEFAVPVIFELTVLFAAFGTVFGMFFLNKLPTPYHPLDRVRRFRKVTDDAFFLSIETDDEHYDEAKSRALLESLGGKHITLVEE